MDDEIDIARRAVGQVMWTYFHRLNSSATVVTNGSEQHVHAREEEVINAANTCSRLESFGLDAH
jgi:hypothetical protein